MIRTLDGSKSKRFFFSFFLITPLIQSIVNFYLQTFSSLLVIIIALPIEDRQMENVDFVYSCLFTMESLVALILVCNLVVLILLYL